MMTVADHPAVCVARYVAETGRRYWRRNADLVRSLEVPRATADPVHRMVRVGLPDWATDLGIGRPSSLLVDSSCVIPGDGPEWRRCDWWNAAFLFLSCAAERAHEEAHGPIHSWSRRLRQADDGRYDHAWVNRILLLLRRQAARETDRSEDDLFGPLPDPVIDLTHDVDAVTKTMPIRLKQTAFHAYNAGRSLLAGRLPTAASKSVEAVRFFLSRADYWCFDRIRALEEQHGVRSTFHVYAFPRTGRRSLRQWLMDPGYRIEREPLAGALRAFADAGWTIGIHPAFDSWSDAARLSDEVASLARVLDRPVTRCRQHWLRFSLCDTWRTQAEAGLRLDTTLGFNDRPGFRNASALRFRPWNLDRGEALGLTALPLVLMDSHLYDHRLLTPTERRETLRRWVDEVRQVHGEASIVWHQRVMHDDYGWAEGYEQLLGMLA